MTQTHPDVTFDVVSHWLPFVSLAEHDDHQQDSIQDNPISGIALAADTNVDYVEYATTHDPNYFNGDDTSFTPD